MSTVLQYYSRPGLSEARSEIILQNLKNVSKNVDTLRTEYCSYINTKDPLTDDEKKVLEWILMPTFDTQLSEGKSTLRNQAKHGQSVLIEIGPKLNIITAYSTNAVSVLKSVGLGRKIDRVEKSLLYLIGLKAKFTSSEEKKFVQLLRDQMTEDRYEKPIESFNIDAKPKKWTVLNVIENGASELKKISDEMGLSFDDWDIQHYHDLFVNKLKRNPTSVECFDLAQSNSEHSRHWFFRGKLIIDGKEVDGNLFKMIQATQKSTNANNIIAFSDNSSAIRGYSDLRILRPANSAEASLVTLKRSSTRHIVFTAETHNFPTGVAPFQGATTGTGGRIRDNQATGRGAHVIAATAGYSFGNLHIPGYELPWEDAEEVYPRNFAKPVEIAIEASNGASDYGNKFGEPVIAGFCRSFGMRLPEGDRWEWIKPIMFSAGIGSIDDGYCRKHPPQVDMLVTKVGGPVYRIGVGGGAASSTEVQGGKDEQLNLEAVQRGDPEMEQKLNRLLRGCLELEENPIQSIHDQGAGGNGNVLKELVEPEGARIYANKFSLADPSITTLELWGAEYQESNAMLIKPDDRAIVEKISAREKCPVDFVGRVSGDGIITLIEGGEEESCVRGKLQQTGGQHPVCLPLDQVLSEMPPKKFHLRSKPIILKELSLPQNLALLDALNRVLRLPSVGSKRFLTNKVDRSVTGLVAQQQCVGELQAPLSDYAMIALSFFDTRGAATSIGEQPIKGLISAAAGARLSVAEAVTNLMFACITCLADVKCSGNWMWPAKMDGEGARLVTACKAMCRLMSDLNVAIDGGKDSLSMAASVKCPNDGRSEVVKSPGTLVISAYGPVPDIRFKVTPVMEGTGSLVYIPLSGTDKHRTGGSALAQVYGQVGDDVPDIDDHRHLKNCFPIIQEAIRVKDVLSGHDISDGGLITCLLEMAIASNCGMKIDLAIDEQDLNLVHYLFAEECGIVIEVARDHPSSIIDQLSAVGIPSFVIGKPDPTSDQIEININDSQLIKMSMKELMSIWEDTSYHLELIQANHKCVHQEMESLTKRKTPLYALSFDPSEAILRQFTDRDDYFTSRPRVAVVREEGINGDREMIASLFMVGFEVIDVTITDILSERGLNLDAFRGLVFPGGFSYADVLGSARGWAATLRFNVAASDQLKRFFNRINTFSLGVCNGCQLMALLGWIGAEENGNQGTILTTNESERYESRFVTVKIASKSNAIMLSGMHDSVLGVWVAHGEGRFVFRNNQVLERIKKNNCIALCYADDDGVETIRYPMNPNGSVFGIAGLSSLDGRHLAMMPHPERCTQLWQWPYLPKSWRKLTISPWCKMFYNAYSWCISANS